MDILMRIVSIGIASAVGAAAVAKLDKRWEFAEVIRSWGVWTVPAARRLSLAVPVGELAIASATITMEATDTLLIGGRLTLAALLGGLLGGQLWLISRGLWRRVPCGCGGSDRSMIGIRSLSRASVLFAAALSASYAALA